MSLRHLLVTSSIRSAKVWLCWNWGVMVWSITLSVLSRVFSSAIKSRQSTMELLLSSSDRTAARARLAAARIPSKDPTVRTSGIVEGWEGFNGPTNAPKYYETRVCCEWEWRSWLAEVFSYWLWAGLAMVCWKDTLPPAAGKENVDQHRTLPPWCSQCQLQVNSLMLTFVKVDSHVILCINGWIVL